MPTHQTQIRNTTAAVLFGGLWCLSGCGTAANLRTNGQHDPYLEGKANFIHFRDLDSNTTAPPEKTAYGGVRYDLYLHEVYSHGSDIYPVYGWFALCDVPLSFVADTVVLPITLLNQSSTSSESSLE